ncbi:hypothetical protein [Streptomyces flavidovirens]
MPVLGRDLSAFVQKEEAVEEENDVIAAEHAGVAALVGAVQAEAFPEHADRVDLPLKRCEGIRSSPPGEVVEGPLLGGLPQPGLGDVLEAEAAFHPEDGAVPRVLVPLGLRR